MNLEKITGLELSAEDMSQVNGGYSYKALLSDNQQIITKTINNIMMIKTKSDITYNMFTRELKKEHLKYLPDLYFPSLVQEKIEKKFEIRAFYINGRIYAMAQFSQLDDQTSVDTRAIDIKKPTRCVPYNLSEVENNKIDLLMKQIGLNCGSIDLIKTKNDNLVFLEVNPVGEFGNMDFLCNFELHKIIAEELIEMDV